MQHPRTDKAHGHHKKALRKAFQSAKRAISSLCIFYFSSFSTSHHPSPRLFLRPVFGPFRQRFVYGTVKFRVNLKKKHTHGSIQGEAVEWGRGARAGWSPHNFVALCYPVDLLLHRGEIFYVSFFCGAFVEPSEAAHLMCYNHMPPLLPLPAQKRA